MTLVTPKRRRTGTVLSILAIVTLAAAAFLYFFNPYIGPPSNDTPVAPQESAPKQTLVKKTSPDATFGLPMKLQIPKLQVDANVSYMGLTDSGEMDVPPDLINVGWYKFGTKPGEIGSAVIAGHLEGVKDLGVFTGLDTLRVGDIIKVQNDRDETISFAVRETRSYKQDERPADVFNKTDGSYLNLITCSGVWSDAQQRYSHRYVVFTEKVT